MSYLALPYNAVRCMAMLGIIANNVIYDKTVAHCN